MSLNSSGSADLGASGHTFPWVYAYEEEPRDPHAWLDKPLLRPTVWVRLASGSQSTEMHLALVDSGCDHVLVPEWVALEIGVTPDEDNELTIRMGGQPRAVHFAEVELQLYPPETAPTVPRVGEPERPPLKWSTTVGFMNWSDPPWMVVLGQCGFFDQFTVTMSRLAQQVAISHRDDFDGRHTRSWASAPLPEPRFEA